MSTNTIQQQQSPITAPVKPFQLERCGKLAGKFLHFFGKADRVIDENTNEVFYVKKKNLVKLVTENTSAPVSNKEEKTIYKRITEIAGFDTRKPLSEKKLKEVHQSLSTPQKSGNIVEKLEQFKMEDPEIRHIFFTEKLSEIAGNFRPGDIIARKYHEDNPNPICKAQDFFHAKGWREAHKCSHIAIFLGQINPNDPSYWIAEASMPHGGEMQIRRISLDDPRFFPKTKNEYVILRNKDSEVAKEVARIARNYAAKMLPEHVRTPQKDEDKTALRYNLFEAIRSLYHSSTLGYFGKQRILKYYADYHNAIPFEYLGKERGFFCSQYVMCMETLAELNTNKDFQEFMRKHPAPQMYDVNKKGFALTLSKLWYSIRKGAWARWNAIFHAKEINKFVKTNIDMLRASPQDVVNYCLNNPKQFELVGMVARRSDYPKGI